ncbi:unnamed protein product [Closterium sp. NIES-65]|nr:unnamed protein product [Closterium sp. NIES-65]
MEVLNRPAVQASGVPISWTLYFPSEEFSPEDRRAELIKSLIDGFLTEKGQQLLQQADPKELSLFSRWTVSMESLKQHLQPACSTGQSDLGAAAELLLQALEAAPEEALACLGAAATELYDQHRMLLFLHCLPHTVSLTQSPPLVSPSVLDMFLERGLIEAPALPSASACASQHASSRLAVRLVDHTDSIIEFKKLKASSLDRLVTVCGTVVRVGPLRPLVVAMDFTCTRCGAITSLSFPDGRFSQPTACGHDNCRNRTFLQNRAGARKINFQTIRLQELTGGTGGGEDMGRMPRVVDCELREDLADACLPGDVVAVCGIVKIINNETDVGGGELYIDAISVVNANSQSTTPSPTATTAATATPALRSPPSAGGASGGAVELGEEDLRGILDYVVEHEGEGDLFQHLVHSFCPSIYGHVLVKAGIILSLFGGVRKHEGDANRVPVRGDVHALLVGDPGMGKSQLLKAAAAVAPRGVYVCGSGASSVGLTVAVVKDGPGGEYAFEAGAMVMADQGTCCIDEFDKMGNEQQALLEAMEQQSVSVAKAGLLANFSARTAVLAAANPVGGHYNRARTLNENLKLSAALLSRFDLIFILLDRPDHHTDQRLSEHVLQMHAGMPSRSKASKRSSHLFLTAPSATDGHASHLDLPLSHRLRLRSSAARNFSPLSPARLRQYIAYARTHVHPRLSEEARAVIKAFYLRLREHRRAMDGPAVPQCIIISLAKPTAIPCVSAARFDYRLSEEARAVIKAFYLRLREHRRAMDGPAVPQCIIISLAKPTAMPCVSAARFDYRLSEEARAVIKAFYLRLREHSRAMDGPPVPQCIIIYLAKPTAIPCVSAARFHYRLSEEARAVIKAFYLRLREHSRAMDGPPITARQLESLVRLAEARARVELREEVTEADAQEAVELMGECLLDKLTDEAGNIDAGRGGSSSKSKESKRFLAALQRTAKQAIKTCFSRKELAQLADDMCLRVPDLHALIDSLNEAGFLLKKGGGLFQVQT